VYKVLVEKPERKRAFRRPRRRCENGIRMDLRVIGCYCLDWIQLAQDRERWLVLANTATNLRDIAPRS
jgi:hypothetical protein